KAGLPETGAPDPVAVDPSQDGGGGHKTARAVGGVALAIGGASAAGMVVSIVVRSSALSSISSTCAYETMKCSPRPHRHASTGKTASLLANVFGGVAIAGVGAGVGLLIYGFSGPSGPQSSSAPAKRASLTPIPLPGGAGALAEVSF